MVTSFMGEVFYGRAGPGRRRARAFMWRRGGFVNRAIVPVTNLSPARISAFLTVPILPSQSRFPAVPDMRY
jgi:hypothetical protein